MSHLTILIERARNRIDFHKGVRDSLIEDSLFRQTIRDLHEYQTMYTDYSDGEEARADRLLIEYGDILTT